MPVTNAQRLSMLAPPPGRLRAVLDTDTYNEIDDQFALAYALLSPEQLDVVAIYAAPFHNSRSSGPEDGMLRSYDEIERVLDRLGRRGTLPVYHGSTAWLPEDSTPLPSAAADDLIARAMAADDDPLYVVAIGAITNVASAILKAPEIIERIVVVWLGGHPSRWHHAREFNLRQDVRAAQVVFDCGVALIHVPCINVAEHLLTTEPELAALVKGKSAIGDYLYTIFTGYYEDHYARSKELWDLGPIAWLVQPAWTESALVHSPILSPALTWSYDPHRHLIRELDRLRRDAIFGDLFRKLECAGGGTE